MLLRQNGNAILIFLNFKFSRQAKFNNGRSRRFEHIIIMSSAYDSKTWLSNNITAFRASFFSCLPKCFRWDYIILLLYATDVKRRIAANPGYILYTFLYVAHAYISRKPVFFSHDRRRRTYLSLID